MSEVRPDLSVTIFGGYLGAGKTTLVNHLLRNADGLRLAVLVNEFGELPIDEDLIEAEDDDIISIAGGCVCCSYGSDMTMALMKLQEMSPRPDHVLLEASGVAIPGAIRGAVSLLNGYSSDGIVIIADAETVRRNSVDRYIGDTITRQLADADLVILNKCDLVDDAMREGTRRWLAQASPGARLLETVNCDLPPAFVLESFAHSERQVLTGHGDAKYDVFVLQPNTPAETLAERLSDPRAGLVRAKGFANDVSGQMRLIQVVGSRAQVSGAPAGVQQGVVCIGLANNLDRDWLSGS